MAYPSGTGSLSACSACCSWFSAISVTRFVLPTSRAVRFSFFFLAICLFAFGVLGLLRSLNRLVVPLALSVIS